MQDKKKALPKKDSTRLQGNYSTIRMLPLRVAAACLVLASSTVIIALAGALAKLLGGIIL
ncbi:hypothetical protein [Marinospirillum insulare]|uniref:Uncharacterized protein n=1 Tax=Marinospirillum insulare TaxID=217169 RepID=A0ABQ6A0T9_9GAMM|nr:hypothetical protein [Marinospirillum insulare]GLR63749.1 hypothetical protein GCM10007878_11840 [Marinospirillum insulare]